MTIKKSILTGVKPTGQPHLGNYLGAMRPAIRLSNSPEVAQSYLFIADYHSLTSLPKPEDLRQMSYEVAASWLACGANLEKTLFYRQSDVPEIFELNWILACLCPKGLMNRAHAYKARVQENQEFGREDLDQGISMGLFNYPVLMAADILMFAADEVPVGEDQVQHIEIARDIAQKFNRQYGEILKIPKFVVQQMKLVPGLDGRKMSKSYDNTIPLFVDEKKLRKLIMKIKTDSLPPEAPKDPDQSILFELFKEFASADEVADLRGRYQAGIGWGEAKERLFEVVNRELAVPREEFARWMSETGEIERILKSGAERVREHARAYLARIRAAIGLS